MPRRAVVVRFPGGTKLEIPDDRIDVVRLAIDRMAVLPEADACRASPRPRRSFSTPTPPTCARASPVCAHAGIAETPEAAPHTLIKQRVNHVRRNGDLDTLHAAARIEADLEQSRWLGRYCAMSTEWLKAIAEKRGVHHVANALSSLATR